MDGGPAMITPRALELGEVLEWPGVGAARAREVVANAPAGGGLIEYAAERLSVPTSVRAKAASDAREAFDKCDHFGISAIALGDREYPDMLARIPDPPPVLYVRGNLMSVGIHSVAVVGTRQASVAGLRIARTIGAYLARKGYAVVSGLALGIDASAHAGALEGNGFTVAVLAHGLDTILPASNRELGLRILDAAGALVSEHAPGVPAHRAEFVRRNRIQSGLSLASVVVESDVEGGAMHQAAFTRRQGRRLLTVLASSPDTRADLNEAGARHLIANSGAFGISTTGDLARELALLTCPTEPTATQTGFGW